MDLRSDAAQRRLGVHLRTVVRAADQPDLAAAGVVDLNLPIDAGGMELGEGSLVIAFEELGAALRPGTLLGSLAAAECALASDDPARSHPLVEAIRHGRTTVELPALEPADDVDACPPAAGSGGRGSADADLDDAPTHRLVGVRAADGPPGIALAATDPGDPSTVLLVRPERARDVWLPALWRARVRQAAYLTGLAGAAWELTADHVRTRRQFGAPLVANQAVAFPLAELAARAHACRLAVRHAAWAHDTGRDATDLTAEALCVAAELALDTTRLGMHLHGAHGLLLSSPVQRCYRRAAVEAGRLGHVATLWRSLGSRRLAGLVEVVE